MRKNYQTPDVSIVMFDSEDIITSSIASLEGIGDNIFDFGKFDAASGINLFGTKD